jgi:hypothetical protein
MTTFLGPDEATNVDLADSRHRRDRDRVACFLHLRDLVYLHPKAASAGVVAFIAKIKFARRATLVASSASIASAAAEPTARGRACLVKNSSFLFFRLDDG